MVKRNLSHHVSTLSFLHVRENKSHSPSGKMYEWLGLEKMKGLVWQK